DNSTPALHDALPISASAYRVSLMSVDLPEPETPVIAVNSPAEIDRSTSLRLLPDAPSSFSCIFGLPLRRCPGTSIARLPLRYCPDRKSTRLNSSHVK